VWKLKETYLQNCHGMACLGQHVDIAVDCMIPEGWLCGVNERLFGRLFVTDAVRRNPLTAKASDTEIEGRMKAWLRGAADRHGGRMQRYKRAQHKRRSSEDRLRIESPTVSDVE